MVATFLMIGLLGPLSPESGTPASARGAPEVDASCKRIRQTQEANETIEYECLVAQCAVQIDVGIGATRFVSLGNRPDKACRQLPYPEKLTAWARLLEKAKKDGRLEALERVGPGPGPEMCKGELRARLIMASSRLLSDKIFREKHYEKIDKSGMYIVDLPFLWEQAETFKEYLGLVDAIGYRMTLSDFEGVVLQTIEKNEILLHDASSKVEKLKIPCNAMTYFRPSTDK